MSKFPPDHSASLRTRLHFRQNRRQQNHDEAEHIALDVMPIPDHPLISDQPAQLIETNDALALLIAHIRDQKTFAFDTEFIGETSFYPHLCLIQIATTEQVALIDPLVEVDLVPLWQLVADPEIRTLVHAGLQDMEPIPRLIQQTPARIFDTQVAAGFINQPYPVSLASLVKTYCGVRLGKGATFTAWDRRPLSPLQCHYAADDVRYLPAIYDAMRQELEACGHWTWACQECDQTLGQAQTYQLNLTSQCQRVCGSRSLKRKELAAIQKLVQWRYDTARQQDMPPRSVLRDDVLVALAKQSPGNEAALHQIRHMPRPVVESYGHVLLKILEDAKKMPKGAVLPIGRPQLTEAEQIQANAMWALISAYSHSHGIDPGLVTSRQTVFRSCRDLLQGKLTDMHPWRQGWRKAFLGEVLEALVQGESQIVFDWHDSRLRSQAMDKTKA